MFGRIEQSWIATLHVKLSFQLIVRTDIQIANTYTYYLVYYYLRVCCQTAKTSRLTRRKFFFLEKIKYKLELVNKKYKKGRDENTRRLFATEK